MKKGKDLIIRRKNSAGNYVAFAGCRSCDIDMSCDVIEVTSPTSGQFREYIAGRKGWRVTCAYLVRDTNSSFTEMLKVGETVDLQLYEVSKMTTSEPLQGKAIVTSCKLTATNGSLLQGSVEFQGVGELTKKTPTPGILL